MCAQERAPADPRPLSGIDSTLTGGSKIRIWQTRLNDREVTLYFERELPPSPLTLRAEMHCGGTAFLLLEERIDPRKIRDRRLCLLFPLFGKYQVHISGEDPAWRDAFSGTVPVAATDYIFAPLIASTPVLLFTLHYFSGMERRTASGDPIPTIVTLSRPAQFDWEHLPADMYRNPYITEEDYRIESKQKRWPALTTHAPKIRHYLEELREISPGASFSFYLNDMHALDQLPEFLAEDDPLHRDASFTFLSDGFRTIRFLKLAFYDHRLSLYSLFLLTKKERLLRLVQFRRHVLPYLDPCLSKLYSSDRTRWWILRKKELRYRDPVARRCLPTAPGIIYPSVPDLLRKVKEGGNWDALSALYGLTEEAERLRPLLCGKKTPVFLIGHERIEDGRNTLTAYERALLCWGGDEFTYLYKPHPASMLLESASPEIPPSLHVIGTTAPLELLIPCNRPCVVAGPLSTSFLTTGDEHFHVLFDCSRAHAAISDRFYGYASSIDLFLSNPARDRSEGRPVDKAILPLLTQREDLILMEFVREKDFEIGLYDPERDAIDLYRKEKKIYRRVLP